MVDGGARLLIEPQPIANVHCPAHDLWCPPIRLIDWPSTNVLGNTEVMATGPVGAEYVEYVLRHKRGLSPAPPPLRLGDPDLDQISFREPDLAAYDRFVPRPMTRDPGEPSEGSDS